MVLGSLNDYYQFQIHKYTYIPFTTDVRSVHLVLLDSAIFKVAIGLKQSTLGYTCVLGFGSKNTDLKYERLFQKQPVYFLHKSCWVFTQRHFLVRNQRFGATFVSHFQGLEVIQINI
jgi:hypothetical protein